MANKIQSTFISILSNVMLSDSKIRNEEIEFIKEIASFLKIEIKEKDFFKSQKIIDIEQVRELYKLYPDRLFIVQQCYYLSLVDDEFHPEESKLLNKLIRIFRIKKADIEVVKLSLDSLKNKENNIFLDKYYMKLHSNFLESSFRKFL
ncbi:MAG: hypothetical protein KBF93_26405 [Leptospiraceae bacterium]|nr:hypothetical protein [Leptospiraceae bacterium]